MTFGLKGAIASGAVLLWALGGAAPGAQQVEGATPRAIEGVAKPSVDLRLGFTIPGRIAARRVEPGDRVEAGQVLMALDDAEMRLQLETLALRAQNDLGVQNAEALWELAKNAEARVREALAQDAAALFEVERAELETRSAFIRLEQARQEKREAELAHEQALARHALFTLRAPKAGVVEEVALDVGETVQALAAVVRVVATDPLHVEAWAPTETTIGLSVGDSAWVAWRLHGGERRAEGRVAHLAQVADAASGARLVRIEVKNPDGLPAGAIVEVRLRAPAVANGG